MNDIVKRLRSNKVTLVGDMKAGIFVRDNMLEAANEIERLRAAITAFGKALSLPGGPSLAVQRHDPSWEAWKTLCDVSVGHQQTGADK